MKFIVSTNDLLKQLDQVDGVVVSKPLIPILENFLFEIRDGRLQVTTTDLETFMTTSMPVESDGDMTIAVPSRVTMDTLKSLPVQPVTFSVDEGTKTGEFGGRIRIRMREFRNSDFGKRKKLCDLSVSAVKKFLPQRRGGR